MSDVQVFRKETCKICEVELITELSKDIGYCSECANKYAEAVDKALEVIEGNRWKLSKERENYKNKLECKEFEVLF